MHIETSTISNIRKNVKKKCKIRNQLQNIIRSVRVVRRASLPLRRLDWSKNIWKLEYNAVCQ